MIKAYIRGQVRRHGAKKVIFSVLDFIARMTPSKKDDEMIAKIKEVMDGKPKAEPKPKAKELEK